MGSLIGDPLVIADTVRNNLLLRCPDASERALQRAIKASCFQEVVGRMPQGLQTQLEARGTNLSGGERQRLGLAQALLGKPRLLFLDEATHSLDAANEQQVLQNILSLGATVVSVAHRGAVIETATRVYEVCEGQVELRQRPAPGARPKLALVDKVDKADKVEKAEKPDPDRPDGGKDGSCKLQLAH